MSEQNPTSSGINEPSIHHLASIPTTSSDLNNLIPIKSDVPDSSCIDLTCDKSPNDLLKTTCSTGITKTDSEIIDYVMQFDNLQASVSSTSTQTGVAADVRQSDTDFSNPNLNINHPTITSNFTDSGLDTQASYTNNNNMTTALPPPPPPPHTQTYQPTNPSNTSSYGSASTTVAGHSIKPFDQNSSSSSQLIEFIRLNGIVFDLSWTKTTRTNTNIIQPSTSKCFAVPMHQSSYYPEHRTMVNSSEVIDLTSTPDDDDSFNSFTRSSYNKFSRKRKPMDYQNGRVDTFKLSRQGMSASTSRQMLSSTQPDFFGAFNMSNNKKVKQSYYEELLKVETGKGLVQNTIHFECIICYKTIRNYRGVTLRNCLHQFCKQCLVSTITNSTNVTIQCPYVDNDYTCHDFLREQEIRALLRTDSQYEKYLMRSFDFAEATSDNTFHCKKPNCVGWCIVEGDVRVFTCGYCKSENCIRCDAIHLPYSCEEFNESGPVEAPARLTLNFISEKFREGKIKHCPKCKINIEKTTGCNDMFCTVCKTRFCWSTGLIDVNPHLQRGLGL